MITTCIFFLTFVAPVALPPYAFSLSASTINYQVKSLYCLPGVIHDEVCNRSIPPQTTTSLHFVEICTRPHENTTSIIAEADSSERFGWDAQKSSLGFFLQSLLYRSLAVAAGKRSAVLISLPRLKCHTALFLRQLFRCIAQHTKAKATLLRSPLSFYHINIFSLISCLTAEHLFLYDLSDSLR